MSVLHPMVEHGYLLQQGEGRKAHYTLEEPNEYKKVLDTYHGAVQKAAPAQAKEEGAKKEKETSKKKTRK